MIKESAKLIANSGYTTAFTGAGVSVESGIPPFRGKDGLWSKYDSNILDLQTYLRHTDESWPTIKELFFDFIGKAKPNTAHIELVNLEKLGLLKSIITQNIDNLHQEAGSTNVFEFHGNTQQFICTDCGEIEKLKNITLTNQAPKCKKCDGLLKPDFIFFGEGIPLKEYDNSIEATRDCKVMLIIGTTGEIIPASTLPYMAKEMGAVIIEINTEKSAYTDTITDYFLQGKATEIMKELMDEVRKLK
ncbi:MAG: NAD-dependent protein deacylase [Ichthyobacteriaceae bacterium]|nr:NAD-dependent protein deacylase [Ichthyobacteriaceae bacterium]